MRIAIKSNIKEVIKHYEKLLDTEKLQEAIIKDMKDVGKQEINSSLQSSMYEDSEPLEIIETETAIGISGAQAIYDEYGTGTIGENNPHPEKAICSIPLNDYNSGDTIRENETPTSRASKNGIPLGGLYWTYKLDGKRIYTQGRPAGMHVYKAKLKVRKELKNIVKKRVGEFLSKQ